LHACYRKDPKDSKGPEDDPFIHSYTATLGSLLKAYTKKSPDPTEAFVIVGVPFTDDKGSHPLPSVMTEVNNIMSIWEPFKCLTGVKSTVDAVEKQLLNAAWVHLACHGEQDLKDPTKSKLRLYKGDLELNTILQSTLPQAQFAFLAACQTATGDRKLVNESFHLGGGLIAAGFRGVVGTLWSMHDPDGPIVAKAFYTHLFRDDPSWQPVASDAAKALQLAVKELRSGGAPYQRWVPFIHMGI
jgi:CHAT domain-containing protein